jgi:hypothetical protein
MSQFVAWITQIRQSALNPRGFIASRVLFVRLAWTKKLGSLTANGSAGMLLNHGINEGAIP